MDKPYHYEIHIEGQLSNHWSGWFEDLAIQNNADGETILSGAFDDQAALLGVLTKLQALNLKLISVSRVPD